MALAVRLVVAVSVPNVISNILTLSDEGGVPVSEQPYSASLVKMLSWQQQNFTIQSKLCAQSGKYSRLDRQ